MPDFPEPDDSFRPNEVFGRRRAASVDVARPTGDVHLTIEDPTADEFSALMNFAQLAVEARPYPDPIRLAVRTGEVEPQHDAGGLRPV